VLPERVVLDPEELETLPRLVGPDTDAGGPGAGGLGGGDGATAIPVTVQ